MRISHEAIYQALYVEARGALKRELVACLRTGRALRAPRARSKRKAWAHVTPEVMISERPAEVDDRAVPGHWEGDLVIGLERSAIGTLVERTTRFTMLVHLPRQKGFGVTPRTKNGPPLAGYGAEAMKNALAATIGALPQQLRRSLTWDRGKELSAHAQFTIETGVPVFFADPHSPWQRGTNEASTAYSVSTSRRALTCPAGAPTTSRQSRRLSTPDLVRPLAGRRLPRPSMITYYRSNRPVLRPPVESAQYTSFRFTTHLVEAGIDASIGTVGDALDNALMESAIGLYKTELIKPGKPWRPIEDVELATAQWVDWFNHRRLYQYCGDIPPAALEAAYYADTSLAPAG